MRFKAWINDGEVILTMKPGDTIRHGWYQTTDEGYEGGCVTFDADIEGVYRTYYTYGKDCDGKISSESVDFCPWSEMKARTTQAYLGGKWENWKEVDPDGTVHTGTEWVNKYEDDPGWPNWQEYESSRHYDQYAEAMNY